MVTWGTRRLCCGALLLVLLQIVVAQDIYNQCIASSMPGFNSDDFYENPMDVALAYCDEASGNSCCTHEYSELIGDFADPLSTSFLAILDNPRSECRTKLEDISCLMCNTAQADWIYVNDQFSTLVMCSSYCNALYEACGSSATTTGGSVNEEYMQASEFCTALFTDVAASDSQVKVLLDQHNRECWDARPECTEDSYYKIYTDCVGDRRNLVWAKKPEANCKGGFAAPANQANLPCALACEPGEKSEDGACVACEAGSYSLGGAVQETVWAAWDELALPFTTYCTWTDAYGVERIWTEENCGWELGFSQVASPPALNNSMSAYLETSVTLMEAGALIFTAAVDSERSFDGLRVKVDRQDSVLGFLSHTEAATYTVPLSAGYHFLQFVYSKDVSVSFGLDQAVMTALQVTHVNTASDECLWCPTGHYANTTGNTQCLPCPRDTHSQFVGTIECAPCATGTYAFEGATICEGAPECTDADYYWRYGPCFLDEESGAPRRHYVPHWVQPHICLSDELPPMQLAECAPCEPGMYRLEDGIECAFCAEGSYSEGDGAPCSSCAAGHEAVRTLTFDEFNAFAYGLSTSCEGDCLDGWVLREDAVDSGMGHGDHVVSTLSLTQHFPVDGTIRFTFSLVCQADCLLSFASTANPAYRSYGYEFFNPTDVEVVFEAPAGENTFTWTFTSDSTNGQGRDDRAILDLIQLRNAAEGGATDCTPCQPGYFAENADQAHCTAAMPGSYVAELASTAQVPCEGNTFSAEAAAAECQSCGENVDAKADHTECEITCALATDDGAYDVSTLARLDNEMYGPIWDASENTYYLNMCTRQHNNHTCFSDRNEPLEVYACQVTEIGTGQDLGSTFGIVPLRSELYAAEYSTGVTVHLSGGSPCHNGSVYFDRQTFIDIPCDPLAGVGQPRPRLSNAETSKCQYEFQWPSLYGCPICTERDYHYLTGECDELGMTTMSYEWNSNPRACHGGVSLPEPSQVQCAYAVYCPPGEYYDVDFEQCQPAPIGFYSVGNGMRVANWTELPDGFSSNGFSGTPRYIRSGEGDTSVLFVHNFVRVGSIDVTFAVTNYGDSTAAFRIYIDDVLQGDAVASTHNQYIRRTINVSAGYHYVRFAFEGGTLATATAPARAVRIQEMTILGISWAAPYPVPCPAGSFSAEEGNTACQDCPWNTRSIDAARDCIPCGADMYSVPGSAFCQVREACTLADYRLEYTACEDGEQQVRYALLQPQICKEDSEAPEPMESPVDCFPCPEGAYRPAGADTCQTCPVGQYWSEEKAKCKLAMAGHSAVLRTSFFESPETGEQFPAVFTTGCSGDCLCRNEPTCEEGWRFRGDFADSGLNLDREVDTFLDLELTLENPGRIVFTYSATGDSHNGLEFYVNDKQIRVPYHPTAARRDVAASGTKVDVEAEAGLNVFRWNYHQTAESTGSISLTSVVVEGLGGSTENEVCQPGEFSPNTGASACLDCPAGTANKKEAASECAMCPEDSYSTGGAAACIQCGAETVANTERTDCETDCVFLFNNSTYDVSALQKLHGPFPLDTGVTGIWMNLCAKRSSQAMCLDEYGEPIKTYMCAVDTRGNGVDYGNRLSVDFVELYEEDPPVALRMSYSVVGEHESECSTTLTLVCDPDAPSAAPEVVDNPTDCRLHMRWETAYGCPVCEDEDYEQQISECSGGDRTIAEVRVAQCNGPAIRSVVHEECQVVYAFSMAVIIVVLVLVVSLVAIIIGTVFYNRRLHSQYTALIRDSEGQYEMEEVEDEEATIGADAAPAEPAEPAPAPVKDQESV